MEMYDQMHALGEKVHVINTGVKTLRENPIEMIDDQFRVDCVDTFDEMCIFIKIGPVSQDGIKQETRLTLDLSPDAAAVLVRRLTVAIAQARHNKPAGYFEQYADSTPALVGDNEF
jgi:hypothetical protein